MNPNPQKVNLSVGENPISQTAKQDCSTQPNSSKKSKITSNDNQTTFMEVSVIILVFCYVISCGVKQMYMWCLDQLEELDVYGLWYGIKSETNGTYLLQLPSNVFLYFSIFLMIRYAFIRQKVYVVCKYIICNIWKSVWKSV